MLDYTDDEEQAWLIAKHPRPLELVMKRMPGSNVVGRIYLRWKDTQTQVPFDDSPVPVRVETDEESSLTPYRHYIVIVQYNIFRVYVQNKLAIILTPVRKQTIESFLE